jgi:hypothetical protein
MVNAKVSYLLSAQRNWLKASNGINGRGPPQRREGCRLCRL